MSNIQNIYINYFFKELDYNPKEKVEELEKEVHAIIDKPLMFNEEPSNKLIGMPRIQGISNDKKYLFTMSLINASLSINVGDISYDDAILLINEKVQLLYDILKEVYNLEILYTSIKIEMVNDNSISILKDKLNLKDMEYEDLSFRRGFINGNYYVNYLINSGKEYNFDVKKDDNSLQEDLFDRTMLVSLSLAKLKKTFMLITIEINDRFLFNKDSSYQSSKDEIRGMIIELKKILNNELYYDI